MQCRSALSSYAQSLRDEDGFHCQVFLLFLRARRSYHFQLSRCWFTNFFDLVLNVKLVGKEAEVARRKVNFSGLRESVM